MIEGLVALALAATTPADAGAVLRSLEEAGRWWGDPMAGPW